MEPAWPLGCWAASIPAQSPCLLPFLQLDELRALVQSTGQEQAAAQSACRVCSTDTGAQVGKLLLRCEKLEEQMDSLLSRQAVVKVVRQVPARSQVGRCRRGGLGRGLPGPPWLVVRGCDVGEPLAAPHAAAFKSAAREEMKASAPRCAAAAHSPCPPAR